ncbi:autotransporter-associated beta strand repeat-containing protein [Aquincola sp. MAHUQ-54]|uniref:Autotransporter-associated beta strand repeat-containing protein n=1 Tax=Aquincola agrisoli TaxID=3119538 RepID=A0AAW9Q9K6_9BURK
MPSLRRSATRRAASRAGCPAQQPGWPVLRPVCAAAALLACGAAGALPQGGTVVGGEASIVTAPSRTEIIQTTQKAAIDWQHFSIGRHETVRIEQPGAEAVLLNRVVGGSPSVLLGQLQSNGRVYLSNPRGIIFGAGGQVDVGGLVATTLSIDDAALRAGRFDLSRGSEAPGAIEVAGDIRAAGTVALVAPALAVAPTGRIAAPRIGLAAAEAVTVDVDGDGLVFFNMRGEQAAARLEVLGALQADGGHAELRAAARAGFADTVLNMEGIVQARTLGVREGRVVIDGGGTGIVRVAGRIDATGLQAGAQGGAVDVLGDRVLLDAAARVDASGAAGGGSLRIGGDFQGANGSVRNASRVAVLQGATMRADAMAAGDGGRVIVWSDEATRFAGHLSARGGAAGGDGGFAEVSGKQFLDYAGVADLGAPAGAAGRLLLDPLNLTIGGTANLNGDATAGDDLSSPLLAFADAPGAGSQITAAAVVAQLQAGGGTSVELQASNNITVGAAVSANSGALTLRAGNSIAVNAPVSVAGGLQLHANDGGGPASGSGRVVVDAALTAAGGQVLIDNHGSSVANGINAAVQGGSVVLRGSANVMGTLAGTAIDIDGGTVTLGAADRLADGAAVTVAAGAALALGGFDETVGSLSLAGTLSNGTLTAATYALAGGTVHVSAGLGTGTLTSTGLSALDGTSAASTVDVASGTLALGGGPNRLADTAVVTVAGGATLALGGFADTVGSLALSGTLSNGTLTAAAYTLDGGTVAASGGLGTGVLTSTGSATLNGTAAAGTVHVDGGTLALGASNRLADGAAVTVAAGATLALGASSDTVGSLSLAGTLAGTGTLTAATYALDGAQVQAGLGAGALTSDGAVRITGQANVTTAAVRSGVLSVGDGGAGGSLGGSTTVAAGTTLRYDVAGPVALGAVSGDGTVEHAGSGVMTIGQAVGVGLFEVSGSGTARLAAADRFGDGVAVRVAGAGRLDLAGFSDTVGSLDLSGTLAGTGTLTAASYTLNGATVDANLGAGTLTSTGATLLNGTAAAAVVNVDGGTLALGASNRLANSAAVTVADGAALSLGGFADTVGSLSLAGTLAGTGTLTAAAYGLSGGTVHASLGAGVLTSTGSSTLHGTAAAASVHIDGGTLALGAADRLADTATVTVAAGATLALGTSSDTVGSLSLAGTLAGTGTLTAATYALDGAQVQAGLGAGALTSDGAVRITGQANVTTAAVRSGVLSVGNGGAGGSLGGSTTVAAGTTLRYDVAGPVALGAVSGDGTVEHAGSGVMTIGQAVGVGRFEVSGSGTARLGADHRFGDGVAVRVAGAGTLDLVGFNDTLGSLDLSGTLAGTGTLTAASYTLNGAIVDANLGAGTLTSTGATLLNGTAAAAVVNVDGGTLALGGANRLGDAAAVTVAGGAVLSLGGFADTVGSLALSGTLGNGTLTAATYALDGGTVSASGGLGAGVLTSTGSSTLNGTAAAGTVHIGGGTLALGASNRLADGAAVTVAAGATLALGTSSDAVGSLALAGTLAGTGTLTAGSYTLSGATVDANLGTGTLASRGASVLNGSAAALVVRVDDGSLSLGAADRLADAAAVSVAAGATLALGSASEAVGSLALSGTLSGTGTLTAATYTLSGATVDANLGAGALASTGATLLNGTAAAAVVNVDGGTLVLGASDRLADGAAVRIAGGATLSLGGFSDTVGSLWAAGTLSGTGTLTAATYTLQGARVEAHLGAGTLDSRGATVLDGSAAATAVTVTDGTLALGAAHRLADAAHVAVAAGAALVLGGDETIGSLAGEGRLMLTGTLSTGAAASTHFAGSLGGAGGLRKLGAATRFTLAGTNAFTGDTMVDGGTLVLDSALASQAVVVNAGTLALGGADRLADGAQLQVARGARLALGAFDDTLGRLSLQGTLDGSGTLTAAHYALDGAVVDAHLGAGELASTGATTLNGTAGAQVLRVDGGSLVLGGGGRLTALPQVVLGAGAALVLGGAETIGSLSGHGTAALGAHVLSTGAGGASRFDGSLTGDAASGLVKQGAGTFVLAGDNRHGRTTVEAGTLQVGVGGASGSLGSGPVHNDGRLLFDRGSALRVDAPITGSGTLVQAGAGRLVLAGTNTYAGETQIAAGTVLEIGEGGTIGGGDVANEGLLSVQRAGTLTLANRIGGSGAVSLGGGGTLVLTADNTYAGGTAIGAGSTLQLGDGVGSSGSLGQGDVELAGTLRNARSGTVAIANRLAGAGTLAHDGAGSLRVVGDNTLTGATVIGPGTLIVGDGGTAGSIGTGPVANAGTLRFERSDDVALRGAVSGIGGLEQAGTGTLRLVADNGYTGTTRILSGTLQVGDGGRAGSLGGGAVHNGGLLRFARADDVTLTAAVTGEGALEQAGPGRLTLAAAGNGYTGGTAVAGGTLATAGDERLPDAGRVAVAAGAGLVLGGAETLGELQAAGEVTLGGALTASTGALVFGRRLGVAATAGPITLRATEIVAEAGDYDFGSQALSLDAGMVRLLSGNGAVDGVDTAYRDLTLGAVTLAQGGRIDAGRLVLDGALRLTAAGGTLDLRAHAAPTVFTLQPGLLGPNSELLALSEAVVVQRTGSLIDTVEGSAIAFRTVNGGSVHLEQDANRFLGGLSVVTGGADFGRAWQQHAAPGSPPTARQDEVRVAGSTIVVGGGQGTAANGIEADVVYLRAGALRTEGPGLIAARLPYGNLAVGAGQSLPGLTLELTDAAFDAPDTRYTFGNPHGDREIRVQVGSRATGQRTDGLDAGFVRVLPIGGARGGTAVYLVGPDAGGAAGYRFFDSGAGRLSEIPVLYNGYLPASPQLQGSLSSVAAVSEQARKDRFEEAVRTENVAVRLRAGVIAEVGPGRPATQGSDGIRLPEQCEALGATLACGQDPQEVVQ